MGLAVAAGMMFLRSDALAASSGTSSLNFTFKSAMTNTDIDPDARGSVNGKLTSNGNASNQQLMMSLTKLDSNTTYQLAAFVGNDISSTNVAEFTTDSKGAFKVTYVENAQGHVPAGKEALPAVLDPLTTIRELDIVNGNTQTVLQVNLTNTTDKLLYLFKSHLDNTGFVPHAVGSVQIRATTTTTQFRFTASGLSSNTDYVLMFNGSAVETNATDPRGRLNLTVLPSGSPDVVDIQAVALTDITSNLVLTGRIPTAGQGSVALGAASTYAIIASASIAGGGDTITGNVGLAPGTSQGIPMAEINGTIDVNDPAVSAAQTALSAAYNDAVSRSTGAISLPGDLGGLTLTPGLYVNSSSTGISGTGANAILTLNAQGHANAVFIFKMASTLTMGPGTSIVLSGGAQAKNVFWQVGSSATLGTTCIFKGNILAAVSITVNNGAAVTGRLFAGSGGGTGSVTVQSSTITVPAP